MIFKIEYEYDSYMPHCSVEGGGSISYIPSSFESSEYIEITDNLSADEVIDLFIKFIQKEHPGYSNIDVYSIEEVFVTKL